MFVALFSLSTSSRLTGVSFGFKSIDCITCVLGVSPTLMACFLTKRFGVSKSFNKSGEYINLSSPGNCSCLSFSFICL